MKPLNKSVGEIKGCSFEQICATGDFTAAARINKDLHPTLYRHYGDD